MTTPERERASRLFATMIGSPPIWGLRQRGRDPETARYTLVMADGREVRIGTIKSLWSQAELGKVLAVTIGCVPVGIDQKDWRKAIRGMITCACEIEEVTGETFTQTVREWLLAYVGETKLDREGAAAHGLPFLDDDRRLHVHVDSFIAFLRGKYGEQPKRAELWAAFADLGLERVTINYAKGDNRNSRSYYRTSVADLEFAG